MAPPSLRAMSRNGPSVRGVSRSSQAPGNTLALPATRPANACSSQVFPIPAFPETSMVVPRGMNRRAAWKSRRLRYQKQYSGTLQTEQPRMRSPLELANAFKVAAAVAAEAWSIRAGSRRAVACLCRYETSSRGVPPI